MAPTVGSHKTQRSTTKTNITKLKDDIVTALKYQNKLHSINELKDFQYLSNSVNSCVIKLQQKLDRYDKAVENFQTFLEDEQNELASNDLDKQLLIDNEDIESYRDQLIDMQVHLQDINNKLIELKPKTETVEATQSAQPAATQQQMIEAVTISMRGFFQAQQEQQAAQAATKPSKNKVKLPKFEIPKFTGDILQWTGFWELFSSEVDSREDLDPIEKFKYLKSFLTGPPSQSVDAYSFTKDNYPIVIDFLKERYGRDNKIVDSHFEALKNLKSTKSDSVSLSYFRDTMERRLRTLSGLGQDVDNYFIYYAIKDKLPEDVRCEMERLKPCSEAWTVSLLREHLREVVLMKENLSSPTTTSDISTSKDSVSYEGSGARPKNHSGNRPPRPTGQSLVAFERKAQTPPRTCIYCDQSHWSDNCTVLPDPQQRLKKNQELRRCTNCFSLRHAKSDCTNDRACHYCGKKGHHRSLCFKRANTPSKPKPNGPRKGGPKSGLLSEVSSVDDQTSLPTPVKEELLNFPTETVLAQTGSILMQTASVQISNPRGPKHATENACTLFDTGSTYTYIVSDLARDLQLELGDKENQQHVTFGDSQVTTQAVYPTTVSIHLRDGSRKKITVKVIPQISAAAHRVPYGTLLPKDVLTYIRKFPLADSIPFESGCRAYQMLIGQDYYYDFILKDRNPISSFPGLFLQNSRFGWILAGHIPNASSTVPAANLFVHACLESPQADLSFLHVPDSANSSPDMKMFWNTETLGIEPPSDRTDHEEAVHQFNDTVKVVNDRYEDMWPKKICNPDLPDNYSLALHRLRSQCKRYSQRPAHLQKCDEIFQNQLKLGIIEKVTSATLEGPLKHYIPHHAVATPDKVSTRTHIVFDASAKQSKHDKCLNDCLYPGPVSLLIQPLIGLLLRFRLFTIAIIADIEKAFLNIGLQIPDRDVTRFLWFQDPLHPTVKDNIQIYRFCRVPFGVNSSPFLLASTVNHLLDSHGTPVALQLRADIYVDNVITGASTVESAIALYEESQTIFSKVKLNLREWSSNSAEFMDSIPTHHRAEGALLKVLGIPWNTTTDTLSVSGLDKKDIQYAATKRAVLQATASVFDPLGYFSPVTLKAKVFLCCKLHAEKFDWDTLLPSDKLDEWKTISDHLREISNHSIPRYLGHDPHSGATFQLICFCDASATSYATAIYLRSVLGDTCLVNLLISKTRIAGPNKKKWTIPRLELMAAVIGNRLMDTVADLLHLDIFSKTLFSDSQCVLHWIKSTKPLSVFVENRIKEIRKSENITYRYVHTTSNPADFATRGRTVSELNDSIWWHGPDWLQLPEENWPTWNVDTFDQSTLDAIDAEARKTPQVIYDVGLLVGEGPQKREMITPFGIDRLKFSSLLRMFRVTSYCHRFISNSLKDLVWRTRLHSRFLSSFESLYLSADELSDAQLLWDLAVQQHWYEDTISSMKTSNKPSNLAIQLGLTIDHQGLIRCRGRFENAHSHTQAAIQPKLLPAKDYLTKLIVEYFHKGTLHSGVAQTLAAIRQQYWIPQGRSRIRSILSDCRICRRVMGGPYKLPTMAPWPKERLMKSPPFTCTGLDYFGPLYIKDDLQAEKKLAKSTLDKVWQEVVDHPDTQNYIASQGIRWKFNVQFAPWTGGYYERMVGLVKSSLKKSIGALKCLTASHLTTLLAEIQAVLNARPLVYLDDDVNSELVISPSYFLVLNPKVGIPILSKDTDIDDPDFNDIPESSADSLIRTWKNGQKHLERFWTIWKNSYLLSLRERTKHTVSQGRIQSTDSIESGDVVLIKDNLPRGSWKLAKVKSLIVSNDGAVRAANVLLPSRRTLTRPINLLYPIECPRVVPISDKPSTIEVDIPPDVPPNLSPMQPCCNTGSSDLPNTISAPIEGGTRPRRSAAICGREVISGWIRDMNEHN